MAHQNNRKLYQHESAAIAEAEARGWTVTDGDVAADGTPIVRVDNPERGVALHGVPAEYWGLVTQRFDRDYLAS